MATKSYLATAFIGDREVSGAFGSGEFRSSLNFARRELRGYQRLAETIYRHEVVFCNRRGLEDIAAPELVFGILTETKDSETGIVESNYSVTSTYAAEDFVSDTRDAFLAFAAEDFGEQIASEAVALVDSQTTSMPWHKRFEIWNCLSSYDIYGVSTANQLIDGVRELAAALADGRTADVDGESPVFQAFHRFERNNPDRE